MNWSCRNKAWSPRITLFFPKALSSDPSSKRIRLDCYVSGRKGGESFPSPLSCFFLFLSETWSPLSLSSSSSLWLQVVRGTRVFVPSLFLFERGVLPVSLPVALKARTPLSPAYTFPLEKILQRPYSPGPQDTGGEKGEKEKGRGKEALLLLQSVQPRKRCVGLLGGGEEGGGECAKANYISKGQLKLVSSCTTQQNKRASNRNPEGSSRKYRYSRGKGALIKGQTLLSALVNARNQVERREGGWKGIAEVQSFAHRPVLSAFSFLGRIRLGIRRGLLRLNRVFCSESQQGMKEECVSGCFACRCRCNYPRDERE